MKQKLLSNMKVYKIAGAFYLQDAEKIYELDKFVDDKVLEDFLYQLAAGIDTSTINDTNLNKTIDSLNSFGFLEKSDHGIAYNPFERKYPGRPLSLQETDLLKQQTISVCGGNQNPFIAFLEQQLHDYSIQINNNKDSLQLFLKTSEIEENDVVYFNKKNAATRNTLFLDLSIGNYAVIGPLVSTPNTPCYQCFCERKWINQDFPTRHSLQKKQIIQPGQVSFFPWQLHLVASLLVHEIISFFLYKSCQTFTQIIYIDLEKTEIWKESLLFYPNCSICSENATMKASWER